ncbi:uncharacterized protein LOC62_02G001791 [Vanrija pseudolonga]|uniref:GP-PDE domain-containing protein n=1 Tax=Vanrija pseudolonga TaxID=143232 RepID=A0AAF0Y5V2_9TREE|nr:hypothetical protein LOC62_02G001791 [Vanrija pseudolonga]
MPAPKRLGVHDILALFRHPPPDSMLVSAHRGLRWDGTPENVRTMASRLTVRRYGRVLTVVLLHDDYLGRVTNIAEAKGTEDVYSPFTGRGYSPRYDSVPWAGGLDQLQLKNETGHICEEGILHLDTLLTLIRDHKLEIVVFMDIKEVAAVPAAYRILKGHTNARGISAIGELPVNLTNIHPEWCVWKMDALFYPSPANLEQAEWFQDALATAKPAYIPVFRPNAPAAMDVVAAAKAWSTRPYVLTFEVGLRGPGGNLQPLLDFLVGAGISVGFFGTYGDVHPPLSSGSEECLFDMGALDFAALRDPDAPIVCFESGASPVTYHSIVAPGESLDGRDSRSDLDLYKSLGYSWTIVDLTPRTADLFRAQARVQPPLSRGWWDDRLRTVT